MASRRETREQQKEVEQSLRGLLRGGALKAGAMLPTVSDLAQEHGVSRYIAHRALQTVGGEGFVHAVPKVGSFAQKLAGAMPSQVILTDESSPHPYRAEIQMGFESRVADHGGAALELATTSKSWRQLSIGGALLLVREERLGSIGAPEILAAGVPGVRIGSHWRAGERLDLVSFDNEAGGFQATQHLLQRGFRSIAFFGVHASRGERSAKEWSQERENGWRRALCEAGLPYHGLAFNPATEADDAEGAGCIGHALGREMLRRGDVRGVVAANDAIALGLLDLLREKCVPQSEWPAIVAFDNSEAARRLNITSLRLPWNDIGQAAADLLWERAQGQLPAAPQHRVVPMRLIPRLSCREKWPSLGAV